MRIDALHLTAFGPFTGTTLDFSGTSRGLHLVYGPNEAGKSSALRALRDLLYGIQERSPHNFIHPYARMRVGGILRSDNGRCLEIIRRKGRTSTLRAADDQTVVDETILADYLNNVDAGLFATMFGIGYEDLVTGGREIVSGGGDLGQLVFSAGSGIVRLKEIRDALQAEAEGLFKPSGKVPAINAALSRLRETEKALRETMLPGNQWERLDAEISDAIAKRESVETSLRQNEKARHHLSRIKQALPLIAGRREVLDSLVRYEKVVRLPDDFAENRRDLVTRLDISNQDADRARRAIEAIEREMAGVSSTDAVIDNAELIEAFHQQLGSQHKAAADRVKLDTRRTTLLGECREILRNLSDELSLADAEALRIKKDQTVTIRRLASEYEQIVARIESGREALPGLAEEIERLGAGKEELPAPRSPESMDALHTILSEASEYGPLEKQNQETIAALDAQKTILDNRLHRLGLAGNNAEDIEKLPVPTLETIRTFEDRFDAAAREIEATEMERETVAAHIRETESRIQARQMAQAVPSEADLDAARERRDVEWQQIRGQLAGNLTDAGSAQTLADGFERHLATADDIADRLRREADRVAEHARLAADREVFQERKTALDAAWERAKALQEDLSSQWSGIWAQTGISARTPREMDRWIRDLEAVKADLFESEISRRKALDIRQAIDAHRHALAGRLQALGQAADAAALPLSRLLFRAKKVIDAEKTLADRYQRIDAEMAARQKELSAAQARLHAGEKALERWRSQWEAAVSPLGLTADARPAEADAVMEEIRTLFEKLKAAETLLNRIQGIDRDTESFSAGVAGLAEAVAPEMAGRPPEDIALQLHGRLTRSREARTRYVALEQQLAAEKQHLETARKTASEIEIRLARMCEEAGCDDHRQLPEAEKQSQERRALEDQQQSLEAQLLALTAGATVEEFVAASAAVDPDAIDPEIQQCGEAIEALTAEKDALGESIGSLRNELSKMDGSAKAATLAEARQEILGRLDPDVRHYARVKVATRILDRAIERFREKNQDPILRRASELFAGITCGSFKGLRAEFDDGGRPVINGVRGENDELVTVSGMSDGTADQLYLSLRLAGLEATIEKSGPMPFIVDDILIKFDNDRAAAALKVLTEISARTQVIFFTHHYHLVELAKHRMPGDTVVYHQL